MNAGNENLNQSIAKILDIVSQSDLHKILDLNQALENLFGDLKQEARQRKPEPDQNNREQTKKHQKEKYDYKSSRAFRELTEHYFYPSIRQNELVSIAIAVANACDLHVERDAKRRKDLLIQWFEKHWETIEPTINNIIVFSKEGDVLNRGGKSNFIPQPTEQLD